MIGVKMTIEFEFWIILIGILIAISSTIVFARFYLERSYETTLKTRDDLREIESEVERLMKETKLIPTKEEIKEFKLGTVMEGRIKGLEQNVESLLKLTKESPRFSGIEHQFLNYRIDEIGKRLDHITGDIRRELDISRSSVKNYFLFLGIIVTILVFLTPIIIRALFPPSP